MLAKKIAAFVLTLSIVSSVAYMPVFAPRTQAIFGIGDIVIDIKALAERIVDGIAMALAQQLIDKMVQSTVQWAQSGFEGNPAYATNPEQFFTNIADGVAGEFIAGSDLDYLCSPFQTQIRLALQKQYVDDGTQFQCTLTEVISNIDAFYGDFSQGGWDAWFSMTQNNTNNPYGAFLDAQVELDARIAESLNLQKEQLDWNQGFLSWSDCEATNPPMWQNNASFTFDDVPTQGGDLPSQTLNQGILPSRSLNPLHVPGVAEGECIKRGPTKTPGSTIKSQLDQILPSGLNKLITAQHVDQLVTSFATGLLNRYVFGSQGLFSGGSNNNIDQTKPTINETDSCETARNLYGDVIDCSGGPFPSQANSSGDDGGGNGESSSDDVCASQEEIDEFMENNPGDEGRLSEAFPCN